MATPTLLQIAISIPFLYMFFFIVGTDPQAKARYFVGSPWSKMFNPIVGRDKTIKLFGVGPAFYTASVVLLERYNPEFCTMAPQNFISIQTLFALASVFIVGRILVGPALEVRKSIQVVGEAQFKRPISFVIYDVLTALPFNLLTGAVYKIIYVGIIAIAIWILRWTGVVAEDNSFISMAIVVAWFLMSLGRLSGLIMTFQIPHFIALFLYLGSILMIAFVWWHAELLLRTCGVEAHVLPSYIAIFLGLFG